MSDSTGNPWDRLPGEPLPSYARFLTYRNLGPLRSIDAACSSASRRSTAAKGRKTPRASGQWNDDASAYRWKDRAAAWDVSVLADRGAEAVVVFVHALATASRRLAERLEVSSPADWSECMAAISTLAKYLDNDAIRLVQDRAASQGRRETASPGVYVYLPDNGRDARPLDSAS